MRGEVEVEATASGERFIAMTVFIGSRRDSADIAVDLQVYPRAGSAARRSGLTDPALSSSLSEDNELRGETKRGTS